MDLHEVIQELYGERERVDQAIRSLEDLIATESTTERPAVRRRGRKSMNQEERREVSRRMRKYWEQRRKR